MQWLVEKNQVDIHETGFNGQNCVFYAVMGQKIKNLQYLLWMDSTLIRARNNAGENCFHLAVMAVNLWSSALAVESESSIDFLISLPFPDPEKVIFDSEESCIVCCDEPPSLIFIPCKHKVVCRGCVELQHGHKFVKCPMCSTVIQFVYADFRWFAEIETDRE